MLLLGVVAFRNFMHFGKWKMTTRWFVADACRTLVNVCCFFFFFGFSDSLSPRNVSMWQFCIVHFYQNSVDVECCLLHHLISSDPKTVVQRANAKNKIEIGFIIASMQMCGKARFSRFFFQFMTFSASFLLLLLFFIASEHIRTYVLVVFSICTNGAENKISFIIFIIQI